MRILVIVLLVWSAVSVVAALVLGAMIHVGRRIPRANAARTRAGSDRPGTPPLVGRHATVGRRSVLALHRRNHRGRHVPGRVRT